MTDLPPIDNANMRWVRRKYIETFGVWEWLRLDNMVDDQVRSTLREYHSSNTKEAS
jgi:hypothetical protein